MFKINIEGTTNYAFQTTIAGVPVQTAPVIDYTGINETVAKELFWNGFKLKFQTVLRTMKPEQVKEMFASGKKVTWRECLSKSAAAEKPPSRSFRSGAAEAFRFPPRRRASRKAP